MRIFSFIPFIGPSLEDFGDDPGTHRPPPLPDRKPRPLIHRYGRQQLHHHLRVVPRHHHLRPFPQRHLPLHIRRAKLKLRPIPVEKRRVPPPLPHAQLTHFGTVPPLAGDSPTHAPRLTSL